MVNIAFLTIGQSPRIDMMPEILEDLPLNVVAKEFGILDNLSLDRIKSLRPTNNSYRLVSRLKNGREAELDKLWAESAIQRKLDDLDKQSFDLIVILCTGSFKNVRSKTLCLEAGRIIDNTVDAISDSSKTIGILVPNQTQVSSWENKKKANQKYLASYASPYTANRFGEAVNELIGADLMVMHCMGYSKEMKRQVQEHTDKPVLLSRSIVASCIRQLL